MPAVNAVGPAAGSIFLPPASTGPVSAATALTALRLRPGSNVEIADTRENIQKNFDALQRVAGRISSLATTDDNRQLQVSALQFSKGGALLAKWAAGGGNTVEVTGVAASRAGALAATRPAYVDSITVADSSANIQRNLGDLQALAGAGTLRQIVQTGPPSALRISAAQLAASGDALAAIRNQAYTLAITGASVSDTLGLGGQPALTENTRIKSIDVRDSTAAIETSLEALKGVGLRLRSIAQTDPGTTLTVTGSQYKQDAVVIGKIITPYQLDVIRATAAQAAKIAANQKVLTVSVVDSAANIAKRWSLMQRLSDSLSAIEVTDPSSKISVSSDQLALSEGLLSKFAVDAGRDYQLSVTGVKADQAATIAGLARVAEISVADSADNVASRLDDLKTLAADGRLRSVVLAGKSQTLSLDAARLLGDAGTATQSVLDRIKGGQYQLAVRGATMDALGELAGNARVASLRIGGSGAQIAANLDALNQLGKRLTAIEQSDGGATISLTQARFDARASVLSRIAGGYRVDLTEVAAARATAYALDGRVASVAVADKASNLGAQWSTLRALGNTLAGVTKTDSGLLSVSAGNYFAGANAALLGKFDAAPQLSITGAGVAQALALGADDAVGRVAVADDGDTVAASIGALASLAAGGKLASVTLDPGATRLSLRADQLDGAQGVLALVSGGRYTLALDEVDVADARRLLTANPRITSAVVNGDAAGIAARLSDLAALGRRLTSIRRSDGANDPLAMTGAAFEQNADVLAKIDGGYRAELTAVAASKAATLAANVQVGSLRIADTGARLAAAWDALGTIGAKLAGVAQSDTGALQLTARQWAAAPSLAGKFSTPLAVSLSGVDVAALSTLAADDAVQQIQVSGTAGALSTAWSELAASTKLTQLQVTDPGTALSLSAADFTGAPALPALIRGGQYRLALREVAPGDAATLAANARVSTLAVTGSAAAVAANFNALAGLDKLESITLSEVDATLTLSASQILAGADTLGKIANEFRIDATGVSLAQLDDLQAVEAVSSFAVSDSAANVAEGFEDLVALGTSLTGVGLTDSAPVLTLSQRMWAGGSVVRNAIAGSYQVDLTEAAAQDVQSLTADTTLRTISVADTAGHVAEHWGALLAAWNGGAGKLAEIALTEGDTLTLTEAQQNDGAAMIDALLPNATILPAA